MLALALLSTHWTTVSAQPADDARKQYVSEWLILGSFSAGDADAVKKDFVGGETSLRPHGGQSAAGRVWRHYQLPNTLTTPPILNFLDAELDLTPVEHAVAYAHLYVHSPRTDTLALTVGYDDGVAIWINGEPAWQQAKRRSHRFDDDTVQVALQKGWNRVLFKVFNYVGEWALSARFLDGHDLTIQAETPERLTTIPRSDPELIRIRPLEMTDEAIFSRDNVPMLSFQALIYNPQQQSLGDCEVRFFAPAGTSGRSSRNRSLFDADNAYSRRGRQIGREQKFPLRAGELRPLQLRVPISTIVSGYQAAGSWQMRLQFGNYEVRRITPVRYDSRLLGRILGTYEVEGIETLGTNGSTEFRRALVLPKEWAGFPVYLSADIGAAEGSVFINEQETRFRFRGDSGDLLLAERAEAGARFEVRIVLHEHDAEANATFAPRLFLAVEHVDLRYYLMYASLLQQYHGGERVIEQEDLEEQMWSAMKAGDFQLLNQNITEAQINLPKLPEAAAKLPDVTLIGSAHIAPEWLWRYPETIDLCRSAFHQAIKNLEKYPDYYFLHDQALAYWWMEQDDPALFEAIRQAVNGGRWEIVGGSWVESDPNMVSGEALARQFLYGKRYLKQKFDVEVKTAWMPDAAGHPWSLPQILKKSGMQAYVFMRPWETMRLFEWEGVDGSRVLGYRPPEWFNSRLARDVRRYSYEAKKEFGWPKALRLFGDDQLGGPTEHDIRLAEDLAYQPATPTVRMAKAEGFFQEIINQSPSLPVHRDEINFAFDGSWTSQARHKWWNRRSEMWLPAAEAFALLAQPYGMAYPQAELTAQWRQILFNQFHDLLGGAGSAKNYADAERRYREASETAKATLDKAMTQIETAINSQSKDKSEIPVVVYNALSWPRTDAVEFDVTLAYQSEISKSKKQKSKRTGKEVDGEEKLIPYLRDAGGKQLLAQVMLRDSTNQGLHYRLLFLPEEVPALGYKVYWLTWSAEAPDLSERARVDIDSLTLSNSHYSVKIDAASGRLQNLVDSQQNREWIATQAGGLELLGERGGDMSALNIDYNGQREHLRLSEPPEVLEAGPLRARLLTRYQYGNSQIAQEYVIYAKLPRIEVRFRVDWHERNKTLKVVYPFQLFDGRATYEIPFAAIERPTNGQEMPMQKWVDLSNEQFGVTVFNDAKYGVDIRDGVVRLTALRAPDSPDSTADAGEHQFAFAIMPHNGDWQNSGAVQNGQAFNLPLIARVLTQQTGKLPPAHSFVSVEPARVVVSALKKAEDGEAWIVRVYESTGQPAMATISLPFAAKTVSEVNLIEWDEKPLPLSGQKLTVNLAAWEVKTLRISQ